MSDLLDEFESKTGHSVPIHGEPLPSLSIWQSSIDRNVQSMVLLVPLLLHLPL